MYEKIVARNIKFHVITKKDQVKFMVIMQTVVSCRQF